VNAAPDETETGLVEYEKAGGSGGGASLVQVAVVITAFEAFNVE
jgi:hypothetical protein